MNRLRDSQLKLLWTARIDYAKGSRVETHSHEDYDQLLLVLSGGGRIAIGGHEYDTKAGSAFLFLKDVPHSFSFTSPTITLDYKFKLLDPLLTEAFRDIPPHCPCSGMELWEMKMWYKASLLHTRSSDCFHPLRIEAGFKGTLVSLLLNRHSADTESYASFQPAEDNEPIVQYLKANFADKITLEQLSKHFGFNPNYLIKLFNDKTGMTPIQFLQEIRLEKAKEYLEFTSIPITEVAEKVGWTLPYFSKILKKRTGMTPSRYRDSLLNAIGMDIILEQDFSNEWRILRW
ncbi:AraC family transcriptional regulator [Paenibacillus filicis]|uniref:AraC family transcriptional regulator n=1 Tax=Paenibacillus gyeongsangnamensis TaxID=3388067 RepID=A0ABT4Q909_9BACL|nr:AraC family transcriptional regulator [Paenibacillus filicis]MCZ8513262.1 AraC family transcriptional regulator [Paenibacillus filicis]